MAEYEFINKVTNRVEKDKENLEKRFNTLQTLVVEYVDPEDIKPNTYNPNRQSEHDFELLMRSIQEDGFTQPVVVHRESRQIVDGEHRWRVGMALGYEKIPVVFVDYTPEQMRIATLRHNRARGSEELEFTALVLQDLEKLGALDWAQSSLMMSDDEMDRLLSETTAAAELAAEEYSQAWDPAKIGTEVTDQFGDEDQAGRGIKMGMGGMITSATPGAAQSRYASEQKLKGELDPQAREEFRQKIEDETYRLQLLFEADEAKIVRAVLGEFPAKKMLEMCRLVWDQDMALRMAAEMQREFAQEAQKTEKQKQSDDKAAKRLEAKKLRTSAS